MFNIYQPIPFYTADNVADTITYIESVAEPSEFTTAAVTALKWVKAKLTNTKISISDDIKKYIPATYDAAKKAHDREFLKKNFIGSVRWFYTMTALSDYMNAEA